MAAGDHQLSPDQAERVWARVEAHIAAHPADPAWATADRGVVVPLGSRPGERPARERSVRWVRVAIVLVVGGLAVALALGVGTGSGRHEVAQTLSVGDVARRAGGRPDPAEPPVRSLVVKVQHPDAVEREESWIDASGRGCFQAQQIRPVADPGGGPQCGNDMVRIGGLTIGQLDAIATSERPVDALDAALARNDPLNTAGVRAELVATLLAWGDIDPAVRAAGFDLLARSGFQVTSSNEAHTVLAGPGANGQIEIVMETDTTQVLRYAEVGGPARRTFTPGRQPLPD